MNVKKIAAAVLVMALTIAAICIPPREYVPTYDDYSEEEIMPAYEDSATQLSLSNGEFTINRRSREEEAPMAERGQTVLVYICGSDAESQYLSVSGAIEEIGAAAYSEDVQVVIQSVGADEWNNSASNEAVQRFVKTENGIECIEELADANMGASETLADFVLWGVESYPARKMSLVLRGCGSGSAGGICFDEKNKDSLTLAELDKALNSVYDAMTDRFEFIGFDASLMATLETANILVPYARYMYASEEISCGAGWDYVRFLGYLAENPDSDGADSGAALCGFMNDGCINEGNDSVVFSVVDLSAIDELIVLFNETAQEIYDGGYINEIAREICKADKFGCNGSNEGYTNMVDLSGLLNAASEYCFTAEDTIEALNNAVVEKASGSVHKNAGGLSVYYPLSASSPEELESFAEVCTSTYYLAFADLMAYGATGGDVYDYDNSWINDDIDNLRNIDYTFAGETASEEKLQFVSEDSPVEISDIYFDEEGIYTVQLYSTDLFNYACCGLFAFAEDGTMYSLGEDNKVFTDLDGMLLQNSFDGLWPFIGAVPLCVQQVGKNDEISVYTSPVKLNDKITNLRIEYDFDEDEWSIIGAWDGMDPVSGMPSGAITEIRDGDIITPLYSNVSSGENTFCEGESVSADGELTVEYKSLAAGDYNYSMCLYDVYGRRFCTDFVALSCNEDGEVYYDPGELDNLQEYEEDYDESDYESDEE